jgi:release factor glutamine methyltransferase
MTVLELLNWSTDQLEQDQIENPRLNAELLLMHSFNLSREGLYVHLHDPLKEKEREAVERLIKRRISGEPLQYIVGHQEFWSIDLKVDPRVLIPRPETELLIEQTLFILSEMPLGRKPSVLEIGTGSGAVATSLAKERKDIFVVATDISRDALLVAKENARSAGVLGRIGFVNGNLFDPFRLLRGGQAFDLILSNPPYVDHSEIQGLSREVRSHEPIIALDGGKGGLEIYHSIASQAHCYLRRGGWLLLELGQGQGGKVTELIERSGFFSKTQLLPDLSGIERVVKSQRMEGGA